MSDEARQVQPEDDEIAEEWLRELGEPGVRNVSASNMDAPDVGVSGWQVAVWAMEFVRSDPLESDFRQRIAAALHQVSGATSVEEDDRETWFVTGNPSGKALVEAAAGVADDLADQTRAYIQRLDHGDY